MTFNLHHPHAPIRVLHSLRGHQRLNPAMALLEIDTHHQWVELALLPLDLVAVCISCDSDIEFAPSTGGSRHLALVAPLRHAPITCRTRGRAQLAIALLTPLGAMRAFGTPLSELQAEHGALSLVTGKSSAALARRLLRVRNATPAMRLNALALWLEQCMAQGAAALPAALRSADAAMRLLEQPSHAQGLAGLATTSGVTPRQLRRDFAHWLGVSPVEYRRVVRLQRSLGHIAQGIPLASIAANQGYADQAHMTREIFDWTGIVPSQVSSLHASPSLSALRHALVGRVAMVHAAAGMAVAEMPS